MSNISKRRKDGSRAKYKGIGDHDEFLKRITKTLYYGQLPSLPCLSLPVTEVSCEVFGRAGGGGSTAARGLRGLGGLRAAAAARLARGACVSPCSLVLALVYLERLHSARPAYLRLTPPQHIFLVSLMVGSKFLQDDGEDDEVICSEWATSGGIELDELKKLEIEFLDAIDWNVFVNEEMFELRLSWLERTVAVRQAQARGFYTYSELAAGADCAEGAGSAVAALGAAVAAAAAAALAYLALLAAALALAHPPAPPTAPVAFPAVFPSSPATVPSSQATFPSSPAPFPHGPSPPSHEQALPNSTWWTDAPAVPNTTRWTEEPQPGAWATSRLQQCARWAAWGGVAPLRRWLPRLAPLAPPALSDR